MFNISYVNVPDSCDHTSVRLLTASELDFELSLIYNIEPASGILNWKFDSN